MALLPRNPSPTQNWGGYLQANPDVLQHWENNVNNVRQDYSTPEAWAQAHYGQFGQTEGRTWDAGVMPRTPSDDAQYTGGTAQPSGAAFDMYTQGGGTTAPTPSIADTWSPAQLPQPTAPEWAQGVTDNMLAQLQAASAQNAERGTSLFNTLAQRANQSLAINPNDPIIRQQTDAYRAEQDRASRNDLANLAEQSSPYANLRGEQRLLSERSGQRTAGFQADLMGQELSARRAEIAQTLEQMGNLLSVDQQRELQRQISLLDAAIQQQGFQANQNAQMLDWQKTMLANESFLKELGLKAEDRSAYYDSLRRGLYRAEG